MNIEFILRPARKINARVAYSLFVPFVILMREIFRRNAPTPIVSRWYTLEASRYYLHWVAAFGILTPWCGDCYLYFSTHEQRISFREGGVCEYLFYFIIKNTTHRRIPLLASVRIFVAAGALFSLVSGRVASPRLK